MTDINDFFVISRACMTKGFDMLFSHSLIIYVPNHQYDARILIASVIHEKRLLACFHLVSYWLPRLVQVIPGGIKSLVILISNEMPDENTDQNTTQPPYRLTIFSFLQTFKKEGKYQG